MSADASLKIINAFKTRAKSEGIDNMSISDFAKSCNIARQTFYYHFDNFEALLTTIFLKEGLGVYYTMTEITSWKNEMYRFLNVLKQNGWLVDQMRNGKYHTFLETITETIVQEQIVSRMLSRFYRRYSEEGLGLIKDILTQTMIATIKAWESTNFADEPGSIVDKYDLLFGSDMHKTILNYISLCPVASQTS